MGKGGLDPSAKMLPDRRIFDRRTQKRFTMKRLFYLFLIWPFLTVSVQSQSLPFGDEFARLRGLGTRTVSWTLPAGVQSRGSFPQALQDSFQQALQARLTALNVKGLSAAVLSEDGAIWTGTAGISHVGTTMTTEMYLGMGSISKTFTSACLLRLQEEGFLSLDDTIGMYLPDYPNVPGDVTIRQLLNHTSGIFNYTDHPNILDSAQADFSRIWTPDEVLQRFVLAPYFAPGAGWHYSNTNYVLAGRIIETVTGQSFHEAVRQRLLAPNGLDSIFLNPQEPASGPVAHVWTEISPGQVLDMDGAGLTPISVYSMAWAAGSYFTRPELLVYWMQKLTDGEILSDTSWAQMTDWVPANANIDYGLGLIKLTQPGGEPAYGHSGYIIYASECYHDTKTGLTMAIQSNDGRATDLIPFLEDVAGIYDAYISATGRPVPVSSGICYPNPATDVLLLRAPGGKPLRAMRVFDGVGREVRWSGLPGHAGPDEWRLNISALPGGVYSILADWGGETTRYRFVKLGPSR